MNRSTFIRSAIGLVSGLALAGTAAAAELSVTSTEPVIHANPGSSVLVQGVITNPTTSVVFLTGVSSDLTAAFAGSNLFNEFLAAVPDSLLPGESWEGPVVRLTLASDAPVTTTHRVTVSFAGGDHPFDDQTLALFTFALNDSAAVAGIGDPSQSADSRVLLARPNPTTGPADISFQLRAGAEVDVRVFDVRGTVVRSLLHGYRSAGPQSVHWDGRNGSGGAVPAGIYFVKLHAMGGVRMTKVVRIE